jgi:hypothetical protein
LGEGKGEKHDKKILQEVTEALSYLGKGRTFPLTDDQKALRQKLSSLTSHHKTQAARAAKRAEAHFRKEIKDLPPNAHEYSLCVCEMAKDVAEEAFSRLGEETKTLAVADVTQLISSYLKNLSRPKPTA